MNSKERTATRMLVEALSRDDADGVERWARAGADLNSGGGGGEPLLITALKSAFDASFKALVTLGADLDKRAGNGATVLMTAAHLGRADMARVLLAAGAGIGAKNQDGHTALHFAVYGGDLDTVKLFAVDELLEGSDERGFTPLMMAAHLGSGGVVGVLLERGANADARSSGGATALSLAAGSGSAEAARELLRVSKLWDSPLANGRSPLMCACAGRGVSEQVFGGRVDVARLLLDKGADVRRTGSDGRSALDLAVKGGNEGLVGLLLERGAVIGRATWRLSEDYSNGGGIAALLSEHSLSGTVEGPKRGMAGMGSV